jgi:uncharacterized protein YlaI
MTRNIQLKGRLKGVQRQKLSQLLDMHYTPSEIGDILGFGRRQFYRVYIPAGCPHERGENDRLWINGAAFREWYFQQYPKIQIDEHEAYCLACKKIVTVENPETKQTGNYRYWSFICPNCGHKMSKAISKSKNGGSND